MRISHLAINYCPIKAIILMTRHGYSESPHRNLCLGHLISDELNSTTSLPTLKFEYNSRDQTSIIQNI